MGFDNECIVNIQSLAGEYFCPVCRLLVYPNEALQAQCTHLYCKPCLTYVVGTTRACPYDGYLVTEADSKPLTESNKLLAETIGKVSVHCLYHRSGCTWQGSLSDCSSHCSGCAFGNSPVVCNRCAIQIVHSQVQEHAQNCPGTQSQAQQAGSALEAAPSTGPNKISSETSQAQTSQAVTLAQNPNQQANPNSQAQAIHGAVPTQEQMYQQYYQQYPGYDHQYQQHYPHQQQMVQQYQQQPAQAYVQPQTQVQAQAQPPHQIYPPAHSKQPPHQPQLYTPAQALAQPHPPAQPMMPHPQSYPMQMPQYPQPHSHMQQPHPQIQPQPIPQSTLQFHPSQPNQAPQSAPAVSGHQSYYQPPPQHQIPFIPPQQNPMRPPHLPNQQPHFPQPPAQIRPPPQSHTTNTSLPPMPGQGPPIPPQHHHIQPRAHLAGHPVMQLNHQPMTQQYAHHQQFPVPNQVNQQVGFLHHQPQQVPLQSQLRPQSQETQPHLSQSYPIRTNNQSQALSEQQHGHIHPNSQTGRDRLSEKNEDGRDVEPPSQQKPNNHTTGSGGASTQIDIVKYETSGVDHEVNALEKKDYVTKHVVNEEAKEGTKEPLVQNDGANIVHKYVDHHSLIEKESREQAGKNIDEQNKNFYNDPLVNGEQQHPPTHHGHGTGLPTAQMRAQGPGNFGQTGQPLNQPHHLHPFGSGSGYSGPPLMGPPALAPFDAHGGMIPRASPHRPGGPMGPPGLQSSYVPGMRDDHLKPLHGQHVSSFPMELSRRGEFENDLKQFPRPSHMDADPKFGGHFPLSRPVDNRGPRAFGMERPDFFGPATGHGISSGREYPGLHPRGFGFGVPPGGPSGMNFDSRPQPFNLGSDPNGSFHQTRFPLPHHLRRGEMEGFPRVGEPGFGRLVGHPRIGEPGNFPPRFGEPGFRSNFGHQDGGFYQGNMEAFDQRKRKPISMGLCRICKVDCKTMEGLELHSQTREHQKVAMDMVLNIKQQNAKKKKLTSNDAEDGSK